MQLTRFDRWLRESFVYQTHIHTLRPPPSFPAGIRYVKLPDIPGKRYNHLFITNNNRAANTFIHQLKEQGQMYTTSIVNRRAWFVPLIAPKNKSVTWWLISLVFFTASACYVLLILKNLTEDPEFRKNFLESLEIIKK